MEGLLWMDEILLQFETMGNHRLLVFTAESSFQGFLGGAGFCPSTVGRHETFQPGRPGRQGQDPRPVPTSGRKQRAWPGGQEAICLRMVAHNGALAS